MGPLLFGHLIGTNDRTLVMVAFLIGAGVMALGGVAEIFLGVRAERAQLEDIAKPLTAEEAEEGQLPGEAQADADRPISREGRREEDEAEQRRREREERRRARDRAGARRYRPGPGAGETFYSPGMLGTSLHTRRATPSLLDREIDSIAAAVAEAGTIRREELARRVGARRWGPGRFRNALAEAQADGRVRRVSRSTFSAPEA